MSLGFGRKPRCGIYDAQTVQLCRQMPSRLQGAGAPRTAAVEVPLLVLTVRLNGPVPASAGSASSADDAQLVALCVAEITGTGSVRPDDMQRMANAAVPLKNRPLIHTAEPAETSSSAAARIGPALVAAAARTHGASGERRARADVRLGGNDERRRMQEEQHCSSRHDGWRLTRPAPAARGGCPRGRVRSRGAAPCLRTFAPQSISSGSAPCFSNSVIREIVRESKAE